MRLHCALVMVRGEHMPESSLSLISVHATAKDTALTRCWAAVKRREAVKRRQSRRQARNLIRDSVDGVRHRRQEVGAQDA